MSLAYYLSKSTNSLPHHTIFIVVPLDIGWVAEHQIRTTWRIFVQQNWGIQSHKISWINWREVLVYCYDSVCLYPKWEGLFVMWQQACIMHCRVYPFPKRARQGSSTEASRRSSRNTRKVGYKQSPRTVLIALSERNARSFKYLYIDVKVVVPKFTHRLGNFAKLPLKLLICCLVFRLSSETKIVNMKSPILILGSSLLSLSIAHPGSSEELNSILPSRRGCQVPDSGTTALISRQTRRQQNTTFPSTLTVPVNFHIASTEADSDLITESIASAQFDVLYDSFSAHNIHLVLNSTSRVVDNKTGKAFFVNEAPPGEYNYVDYPEERNAYYRRTRRGGIDALNIYFFSEYLPGATGYCQVSFWDCFVCKIWNSWISSKWQSSLTSSLSPERIMYSKEMKENTTANPNLSSQPSHPSLNPMPSSGPTPAKSAGEPCPVSPLRPQTQNGIWATSPCTKQGIGLVSTTPSLAAVALPVISWLIRRRRDRKFMGVRWVRIVVLIRRGRIPYIILWGIRMIAGKSLLFFSLERYNLFLWFDRSSKLWLGAGGMDWKYGADKGWKQYFWIHARTAGEDVYSISDLQASLREISAIGWELSG